MQLYLGRRKKTKQIRRLCNQMTERSCLANRNHQVVGFESGGWLRKSNNSNSLQLTRCQPHPPIASVTSVLPLSHWVEVTRLQRTRQPPDLKGQILTLV